MNSWIGCDLDGCLAHYDRWRGIGHIGAPIPAMVARVKSHLDDGDEVRIFTARIAPYPSVLRPEHAMPVTPEFYSAFQAACVIADWCRTYIGQVLPITCMKDHGLVLLYDDRCFQVVRNTGRVVEPTF